MNLLQMFLKKAFLKTYRPPQLCLVKFSNSNPKDQPGRATSLLCSLNLLSNKKMLCIETIVVKHPSKQRVPNENAFVQ